VRERRKVQDNLGWSFPSLQLVTQTRRTCHLFFRCSIHIILRSALLYIQSLAPVVDQVHYIAPLNYIYARQSNRHAPPLLTPGSEPNKEQRHYRAQRISVKLDRKAGINCWDNLYHCPLHYLGLVSIVTRPTGSGALDRSYRLEQETTSAFAHPTLFNLYTYPTSTCSFFPPSWRSCRQ
jgi:hypothetical protein